MENVSIYIRESNHLNAQEIIRRQEEKVTEYCKSKKYFVCDSAVVIGDREETFPALLDLLEGAKEKEITKIVMTSTNRVVGEIEDIKRVAEAFKASDVTLETIDGSDLVTEEPNLVPYFLNSVENEEEE